MGDIYQEAIDKIIFLYKGYSNEHRGSTQPYHLEKVLKLVPDYKYECNDLLVREPLIEHSGSLPIVATTIYPYINNQDVDLGKALIMLAIHDIGELTVGDEITFVKTGDKNNEMTEALKLLPDVLKPYYIDMEERKTDTARFAKAVDKITPDIVDLMTPVEVTLRRYREQIHKEPNQIIETIKEFKHPYMIWNEFMKNLHLEILNRIEIKISSYLTK